MSNNTVTGKHWTVGYMSDCGTSYPTYEAAEQVACRKTATDRDGDEYFVYEAVARATQPQVPVTNVVKL